MTRRISWLQSGLVYATLTLCSLFVIIPVLWMISTSLKPIDEVFAVPPKWIPERMTFGAFGRIWTEYPFLYYFRNSLTVVLAATLISLFFSSLAGYGASRFHFRGKSTFLTFLLATQMFPSIMLLIPFFKIMQTFDLVNTLLGLILTYITFTIPLCSWMMMGYFDSISRELDDAAAIDGCSRFRTFVQIILPLSLPGLVATAIYAFLTGWNEYMFALVLTHDETMKTVPVGIGQMTGENKLTWNDVMSASLVATLPLLLVFLFLQRYFINSLTAGAVKS